MYIIESVNCGSGEKCGNLSMTLPLKLKLSLYLFCVQAAKDHAGRCHSVYLHQHAF